MVEKDIHNSSNKTYIRRPEKLGSLAVEEGQKR